ncbi:MAG: cupin domain-containing protein [Pseudomonadota bacterium]
MATDPDPVHPPRSGHDLAEDIRRPWWAVLGPEDGEHWWQPEPSGGYVSVKMTPETTPYDDFSCGIQVLPPGGAVREHGHRQNHELIHIYEGTGECEIEGETYRFEPGSTILVGRYARHLLTNTGDVDVRLFWVFFPAGLEHWFRALGRPRTPGEPMPEPFERPANVAEVMARQRFVPPRGS